MTAEMKNVKKTAAKKQAKAIKKPAAKKIANAPVTKQAAQTVKNSSSNPAAITDKPKSEKKTLKAKKKGIPLYTKPKKPASVKAKQKELQKKKKHPTFRGRFGNKNVRKISKARWSVWRKTKGIDPQRKKEDGAWPMIGYQNDARTRDYHPSGYIAQHVNNVKEMELLKGQQEKAAIIAATVGKKKKREMLQTASKLGIAVLNRGK